MEVVPSFSIDGHEEDAIHLFNMPMLRVDYVYLNVILQRFSDSWRHYVW